MSLPVYTYFNIPLYILIFFLYAYSSRTEARLKVRADINFLFLLVAYLY